MWRIDTGVDYVIATTWPLDMIWQLWHWQQIEAEVTAHKYWQGTSCLVGTGNITSKNNSFKKASYHTCMHCPNPQPNLINCRNMHEWKNINQHHAFTSDGAISISATTTTWSPKSTQYAIIDSGCTSIFSMVNDFVLFANKPLKIALTDFSILHSTHTFNLKYYLLPPMAWWAHIAPGIRKIALISIATLIDATCQVCFWLKGISS